MSGAWDAVFGNGQNSGATGQGQQQVNNYQVDQNAQTMQNNSADLGMANAAMLQAQNRQAPTMTASTINGTSLANAPTIAPTSLAGNQNIGTVSQFGGAQAGPATNMNASQLNLGQSNADRNQQLNLANTLTNQVNGGGPSLSAEQFRAANDAAGKQAMSLAASMKGGVSPALAQRMALNNVASTNQTNAENAAQGRIQEQQNAINNLGGTLNNLRSTDVGTATTNANLSQEANTNNMNANNQFALANLGNTQAAGLANMNAVNERQLDQANLNNNINEFNAGNINSNALAQANLYANANLANAGALNQTAATNAGYLNAASANNQNAYLTNQGQSDAASENYMGTQVGIDEANRAAALQQQQLNSNNAQGFAQLDQNAYQNAAKNRQGFVQGIIGGLSQGGMAGAAMAGGSSMAAAAAKGGSIGETKDQPYLVGEEGPELVVPKKPGYVMTAQQTAALLGAPPTDKQMDYLSRCYGGPMRADGGPIDTFNVDSSPVDMGTVNMNSQNTPSMGQVKPGGGGVNNPEGKLISGWAEFAASHPGYYDSGASHVGMSGLALSDEKEKDVLGSGAQATQNFLKGAQGNNGSSNAWENSGDQSANQNPMVGAATMNNSNYSTPTNTRQNSFGGGLYQGANPGGAMGNAFVSGGNGSNGGFSPQSMGYAGGVSNSNSPYGQNKFSSFGNAALFGQQPNSLYGLGQVTPQPRPQALEPQNTSNVPQAMGLMATGSATSVGPPPVQAPPQAPPMQAPNYSTNASNLFSLSDVHQKDQVSAVDSEAHDFMSKLGAHKYRYKDPSRPGAGKGEFISPMAQEFEKSDWGKNMVRNTPNGKMVDYGKGMGFAMAAMSNLNKRLERVESGKGKRGGR